MPWRAGRAWENDSQALSPWWIGRGHITPPSIDPKCPRERPVPRRVAPGRAQRNQRRPGFAPRRTRGVHRTSAVRPGSAGWPPGSAPRPSARRSDTRAFLEYFFGIVCKHLIDHDVASGTAWSMEARLHLGLRTAAVAGACVPHSHGGTGRFGRRIVLEGPACPCRSDEIPEEGHAVDESSLLQQGDIDEKIPTKSTGYKLYFLKHRR